jgi:sn-glycerol 3-phosphate transport system substrate-binding protein
VSIPPLRIRMRRVVAGVVVALGVLPALAAPGAAATPAKTNEKCPLDALKKAKDKPVQVTFWHSMNRALEESITRLTDKFNSSQNDVRVKLVNQTSYEDTFEKFKQGLSSGDLPDFVQIQDISLQQMIDSQAILPAEACAKADHYKFDDHLRRVVDYYTVNGTLWPVPFNVSNPVLYYDKAAFRKAGLDPDKPPATLDEVRTASEKLKSTGAVNKAGFGLKIDSWFLEQWLAKAGDPYVNNGNGRKARATKVQFQTKTGQEIFDWMAGMVKDGLAETNPATGANGFNNLLGIGSHDHAMTVETSAALGTIAQVLSSGQYADVELGVAPMPGPSGKGGVLVGGGALYISKKSSPEKQAAAWRYGKFLNEPEQQAQWAADTGYVPIRKSAVNLAPVQQRWAQIPGFKIAYDQLTQGVNNTATAGPVIGDYQGVRDVVIDSEQAMFTQGKNPKASLKDAVTKSNKVIGDYNSRVGA